jgi:hypothetical protein
VTFIGRGPPPGHQALLGQEGVGFFGSSAGTGPPSSGDLGEPLPEVGDLISEHSVPMGYQPSVRGVQRSFAFVELLLVLNLKVPEVSLVLVCEGVFSHMVPMFPHLPQDQPHFRCPFVGPGVACFATLKVLVVNLLVGGQMVGYPSQQEVVPSQLVLGSNCLL